MKETVGWGSLLTVTKKASSGSVLRKPSKGARVLPLLINVMRSVTLLKGRAELRNIFEKKLCMSSSALSVAAL